MTSRSSKWRLSPLMTNESRFVARAAWCDCPHLRSKCNHLRFASPENLRLVRRLPSKTCLSTRFSAHIQAKFNLTANLTTSTRLWRAVFKPTALHFRRRRVRRPLFTLVGVSCRLLLSGSPRDVQSSASGLAQPWRRICRGDAARGQQNRRVRAR